MKWFLVLAASSALSQSNSEAMRAALAKQRAAAELQREAARKQAEMLKLAPLVTTVTESHEPDCQAIPDAEVNPIIDAAAKAQEMQPELVRAVIRQESQFYPCAVSPKGAQGLMQLMPATAEQLAVHDPFDPKESVEAGTKYLKLLLEKYKGNLALALSAYNAGPSVTDEAKGIPTIPETRAYVEAILDALGKKAAATAEPDQAARPTAQPDAQAH